MTATTAALIYIAVGTILFAVLTVLGAAHQRNKQVQRDREERARGVGVHGEIE